MEIDMETPTEVNIPKRNDPDQLPAQINVHELHAADPPWVERLPQDAPMTSRQKRRLFAQSSSLGFTPQDRRDLAEMILKKDIESWKTLTFGDANRLIDAFEGFEKISWILTNQIKAPNSSPRQ